MLKRAQARLKKGYTNDENQKRYKRKKKLYTVLKSEAAITSATKKKKTEKANESD